MDDIPLCLGHAQWIHDFYDEWEREALPPRDDLPGYVYFVRSDGLIKIGFTEHPEARLKKYPPTADVLLVAPGTRALEKALDRRFAVDLERGREWFRESRAMRRFIRKQLRIYGPPRPEWSTKRFTSAKDRERSEEERWRQVAGTRHNHGVKKTRPEAATRHRVHSPSFS